MRRWLPRGPSTVVCAAGLVLLVLCTAVPHWVAPMDPFAQSLVRRLKPPAWAAGGLHGYWLGTDQLGRDTLSRIVFGARVTLVASVLAVAIACCIGTAAGLLAGYYRGVVDGLVVRLIDIQLAFPVVLLVIAIVAVIGPSLPNLILVMGLSAWPQFARIARGAVIAVRDLDYVEAARAVGARDGRIIVQHVLRNVLSAIIVYATFEMARMILIEATLSFLGLGVQPPVPTWGGMISDGSKYLNQSWAVSFFPGLAIVLTVLLVNTLGDLLRDRLDPVVAGEPRLMRLSRAARPETPAQERADLLSIGGLQTSFRTPGGDVTAVDGVDLSVGRGRTLAIVGESGCGKSALSLSIMRLLPANGQVRAGHMVFDGQSLLALGDTEMHALRGGRIAMIFQEPMTSLNPSFTVGTQIIEAILTHRPGVGRRAARRQAIEALRRVGIPVPDQRIGEYPHQLSGGMRQRAMIAMALACEPDLLIADEPTTALDVTVQAQILDLLRRLQRETGMAILLITHDLGVVAELADDVAVMYAGRVVERAPVRRIFADPQHPYTLGLLGSIPRLDVDTGRLEAIEGSVPPLTAMPPGCRFHPRCDFAVPACARVPVPLAEVAPGHWAACIRAPVERHEPATDPALGVAA